MIVRSFYKNKKHFLYYFRDDVEILDYDTLNNNMRSDKNYQFHDNWSMISSDTVEGHDKEEIRKLIYSDNWANLSKEEREVIKEEKFKILLSPIIEPISITNHIVTIKIIGKIMSENEYFKRGGNKRNFTFEDLQDSIIRYCHIKDFLKKTKPYIPIIIPDDLKKIYDEIEKVAKSLKYNSDDYGELYYNHVKKQIWFVASDGDSDEEMKDIKLIFKSLPYITKATIESETYPVGKGWIKIKY